MDGKYIQHLIAFSLISCSAQCSFVSSQPLHEGARGGHVDVVRYLVERGADIHERSHYGAGGSALFYAIDNHGQHHPVTQYLKSLGATSIGPEL
jgi:ankyrin repeat protein